VNKFETSVKAKRAAKAEEAEKKAPPWSYKGWEDPNLVSERELMMRGIKGHCQKTVEAIIGRIIGKDTPINVRVVSSGTLACITFRNKKECTAAWGKLYSVKNPLQKAATKWLTCVRAKYKEKRHPSQKEWDDIKNRWATPAEMSEESTRDKGMREEGR
jgi:hypothetical protein